MMWEGAERGVNIFTKVFGRESKPPGWVILRSLVALANCMSPEQTAELISGLTLTVLDPALTYTLGGGGESRRG